MEDKENKQNDKEKLNKTNSNEGINIPPDAEKNEEVSSNLDKNKDNKDNKHKKINNEDFENLKKQAKIVEIRMKKPSFLRTMLTYLMIMIIASMLISYLGGSVTKTMSYTELLQNIEKSNITAIKMQNNKQSINVILKDDKEVERVVKIPDAGAFIEYVQPKVTLNEFELTVSEPSLMETLAPLIPTLLLLVGTLFIFAFMLRKTGQGNDKAMGFGKSRAKLSDQNSKSKATFENVAGLIEEKEELQEIVDFLKNPKKYKELGARIPRGLLLVGGPGTGKTLLARAVSGEAGVPFFSISGSDFVEMFVGVGASRVRDLFNEAKSNAPCIIFIDEIDAVGRQRGAGVGGGHDEREQTLNQLLVEMDGFVNHENVIVIAATNRPDILDKALLRPGRFDRQIVVHDPDIGAREDIIKLHAKNKPFIAGIDYRVIAKNSAGFSGADLENMVNESALLAARKNKKIINMEDIEEAMIKVMMGPEKHSRIISEKERKLTAYHEAGHAVVSRFLPTHDTVHQISIIPRGMAGGYTMYKPNEDKSYRSKSEMQEHIVSLLGGRVAEQLVLNDISTGASSDIERASKIARSMVMKYGMSEKLGPITFGAEQEEVFLGRDINNQRNFSEKIAAQIDDEIKNIIDNGYRYAERVLKENIDKLHRVSEILLEKEKMGAKEFDAIFAE
ncbi:MAG: ATP-dependent zinc metalloprotease FtsH [Clostridia bacterium]|nr:ATP-dependent zinc metalloprotease FtsH [Clostridia bacterium]MDD4386249.1 ATP-dependent zinc metalloprotease FtsH [Clostridia bacterium]